MNGIRNNYNHTITAAFIGYVVQAIVNNFVPLLFLTFRKDFGISLEKLALLVTVNFGVQLTVDFLSAGFIDKIGYKKAVVAAHFLSAAGLVGLGILPTVLSEAYIGILIAVVLYAIGGGLLEVIISPVVEACPTKNKAAAMNLLHSFYCWGHVFVIAVSTAFFFLFGIENWRILAFIWAAVPILNGIYFILVPVKSLNDHTESMGITKLLGNKLFWIMMILMVCAGACEQGVSQWASAFAEEGLGVSKTIGDITGPMMFAIFMGLSRIISSKAVKRISIGVCMALSGVLCLASYLLVSLSSVAFLGLTGCAMCGFSVGALWPGTFSIASKEIPGGNTAMFALLALGGDAGCAAGPYVVGAVSDAMDGNLHTGILVASVFPILLLLMLLVNKLYRKKGV